MRRQRTDEANEQESTTRQARPNVPETKPWCSVRKGGWPEGEGEGCEVVPSPVRSTEPSLLETITKVRFC